MMEKRRMKLNQENLPVAKPKLFVVNHLSLFSLSDLLAMASNLLAMASNLIASSY